uniref:Uncharacterized protein n=1 Tax=Caenorhabditis tropicalis TaxID=1561998 RepID=A0A1I7T1Y7_9PELO
MQCHLLDIYRRQHRVQEQATLPFSHNGRQKYLDMLRELFCAEAVFERIFGRMDTIEEEDEEEDEEMSISRRGCLLFLCIPRPN